MKKFSRSCGLAGACALAALALTAPSAFAECTVFTRVCVLTGSQEVPPTGSGAYGAGKFLIDTNANTVTYRIVYNGFAETAAHIHGMADPGVSAGVLHALPAGNIKTGTWTYMEAQEADILNGRTYANIHSAAFPGGEIRGQIVSAVAILDPGQEVPPVTGSTASGFGLVNIDTTTNQLSYYVAFSGLSAAQTAAHIHGYSIHQTSTGVLHPLTLGSPSTGTWTYPEAEEQRILDGMIYFNVHTTTNPGGEIRGQICTSVNPMDGGQEVPPVPTSAAGYTMVSLNRATDMLGYDVQFRGLSSAQTAGHIHGYSAPGVSSGVQHGFAGLASPTRGVWSYPAAREGDILGGLIYSNIHTTSFGGGEIRGQITQASLIPSCPADLNCDGFVDFTDYLDFLNRFDAGDLSVDFNGDGMVDFSDYLEFLNHFDAGC